MNSEKKTNIDNQSVNDEEQKTIHTNVCFNCGAMLTDGQVFCSNCGKSIGQSTIDSDKPRQTNSSMVNGTDEKKDNGWFRVLNKLSSRDLFLIGGVISGVISVIFGIVMSFKTAGFLGSMHEYGGDAYTGIQNAAAQTANNVLFLGVITRSGCSFILVSIGLIAAFYFMSELKTNTKIQNNIKKR